MQQGDSDTVRTQIRDATLANVTATLDGETVQTVEWAATDSVDRLALGVAAGVSLGDFYARPLGGV